LTPHFYQSAFLPLSQVCQPVYPPGFHNSNRPGNHSGIVPALSSSIRFPLSGIGRIPPKTETESPSSPFVTFQQKQINLNVPFDCTRRPVDRANLSPYDELHAKGRLAHIHGRNPLQRRTALLGQF
jgi:hypothetical protein